MFEWDEDKNRANIEEHGISFADAQIVFDGPHTPKIRSDRHGEERWIIVGPMNNLLWAVVFTERGDVIHIISTRRARRYERDKYHALLS